MKALIVRNSHNNEATDAALLLTTYLNTQNITCEVLASHELYTKQNPAAFANKNAIDIAFVLGGDGAILRTAQVLKNTPTPILGINFGHLGFLANDAQLGVVDLAARALAGELLCERRTNLQALIVCEGDVDPYSDASTSNTNAGEDAKRTCFALNEIAVTRGAMGRTLNFSLDIDDIHIGNFGGDGAVVASATGSTAYALAAGGPLVAPSFGGLIVQPIAPHTLSARTVVTNPSDIVCITLERDVDQEAATVFADGDLLQLPAPIKCVYVQRGNEPTHLLYADADHFYHYAAKTFFGV